MKLGRQLSVLLIASLAAAQTNSSTSRRLYAYVGALDSHSVTLAWGSRDAIGRSARAGQPVTAEIGGRMVTTTASWVRVEGLTPDRDYTYSIRGDGTNFAAGRIRTWPERADSLVFFVIGDWGSGDNHQKQIAARMTQEYERLEAAGKHVRFVLSTGDNLYARYKWFGSGSADRHWESRFLQPYERILESIPFYAVLGNHDGNESESRGDLDAYLDNFFFPVPDPARWYRFEFGGLAEFFALDSTQNTRTGPPAPAFSPGGEQTLWLRRELEKPSPPWRTAWMHHPMFTAGPEHLPSLPSLRHWFDLFTAHGVQTVFAGHEHNFQLSERSERTGGMQFVVSGAGGQLRDDDIRHDMGARAIAAWGRQRHFLLVEMTAQEMLITPIGAGTMEVLDQYGKPALPPFRIPRVP